MSKREGVLSWDEYFMSLALLSSQRSKDPATQVGAVIVNKNKRIIGIGYNGFPHGCSDDDLPWGKSGQWEDTKYPFGKDPDGEIKNSRKSIFETRIPNFCNIQVIVFDLSPLP